MFLAAVVQLLFDSRSLLSHHGIQVTPELEDHAFCMEMFANILLRELCVVGFDLSFMQREKNTGLGVGLSFTFSTNISRLFTPCLVRLRFQVRIEKGKQWWLR